jgi:peroxiredoxin
LQGSHVAKPSTLTALQLSAGVQLANPKTIIRASHAMLVRPWAFNDTAFKVNFLTTIAPTFMNRIFTTAAILIAGLLIGAALLWKSESIAPNSTFVMLDGSTQQTSDLKGQVTLVNFWATSCVTCVAEMPEMVNTFEKFKGQGFRTLAVSMQYDPPSYVVNFVQSRKLPFDVAIDNTGAIAKAWGDVQLTPTSYLVDKKGRIVKRYVGTPDFAQLNALIAQLLLEA